MFDFNKFRYMSDHKNKTQNTYRGVSYNISDTASKNSSSQTEGVYRGVKYNLNNLKRNVASTSKGVYRGVEFSI